jgi:hypothetical protein
MSFLEKAKQKIAGAQKILGEETVRVVNYKDDSRDSELEHETSAAPASKPKSENRDSEPSGGSVFNIEEKVSFFGKKKKPDAIDEAAEELVRVDQNKIKDVLEILEIPATFEIGQDMFLPEDITDIEFDYQTPHGYDMGQVGNFVEQARDSVVSYVKLLKLRNEHIAKLATVVDRLQVDLNNQRFDSEIANGINIMPTQDDDDLNNKNMELTLLVMRLREELAALKEADSLSTNERQAFEDLQDQLSIVTRDCERLNEENYELRTRVSFMEEDLGVDPVENEKVFASEETSHQSSNSEFNFSDSEDEDILPDLMGNSLPNFGESLEEDDSVSNFTSAFHDGEDLTLDEFILENQKNSEDESDEGDGDFSTIEIMGSTPTVIAPEVKPNPRSISIFDEEEDDELDAIMKQEFGEN